jgi:uronate dehydrogenase
MAQPRFPFEQADLTDSEQVAKVSKGVDAIVHLAIASRRNYKFGREVLTEKDEREEHQFHLDSIEVNIKGTYNLFRAAKLASVRQVVYVSSLTVVMGKPPIDGYPELATPHPLSLYGASKLFGEHLGEVFSREHGMNVICLRLGQPYPFGEDPREKERKFRPEYRGALLGLEDIAQAIECSLKATHIKFGSYNIVSESAWRNIDISAATRDLGYVPRQFCNDNGEMISQKHASP